MPQASLSYQAIATIVGCWYRNPIMAMPRSAQAPWICSCLIKGIGMASNQFKVGFGSSWRMWGQFVLKAFEQVDIVNCKAGQTYCILWGGEKGQDKPEWGLQGTHIFQPSTTRQHLQGEARSLGREHNMQEKYPFWRDTMHGKYVCWAAKCRSGTKAKCAS